MDEAFGCSQEFFNRLSESEGITPSDNIKRFLGEEDYMSLSRLTSSAGGLFRIASRGMI